MPDICNEIKFKTARSGGSGGQNVNKVETMVEGYWNIESSALFNENEKSILHHKLANKISAAGFLQVKSQQARTQLANKAEVVKKMNLLVAKALIIPKKRKAAKIPKAVVEKRLAGKKIAGDRKISRKKIDHA